jgi:hypothetical protein
MTIYYYELALQPGSSPGMKPCSKAREELFAQAGAVLPPEWRWSAMRWKSCPFSRGQRRLRLVIETRENIAEEREHKPKEE